MMHSNLSNIHNTFEIYHDLVIHVPVSDTFKRSKNYLEKGIIIPFE